MFELLIATKNKGKIKEFEKLLEKFPIKLKGLKQFNNIVEVEETGKTFEENAKLKATSYALQTNCWALADDSGLEVKALKNKPGIFSARYAGKNSTDKENIEKLLKELNTTKPEKRLARFVCSMAISDEKGKIQFLAQGFCNGQIALTPIGTNGFGYDPVFIPNEFEETFGQLPDKIKQKISHRSIATKKIIQFLAKNAPS